MTIIASHSRATNPYELAVVAALRAHQLIKGCTPRFEGAHKATTMARMEVAAGKVARIPSVVSGSL